MGTRASSWLVPWAGWLQEGTRDLGEDRSVLGHPQQGEPRVGTHRRCSSWVPTGLGTHPQGSQTPSPHTKRGHEVRPRSTVATPSPFPPARAGGALRLAVPLKIPPPSALLNSLAAGKRQQGRNEAPNVITVLVSLPPASSQPHLSRRQRAGREERNQCLSLA